MPWLSLHPIKYHRILIRLWKYRRNSKHIVNQPRSAPKRQVQSKYKGMPSVYGKTKNKILMKNIIIFTLIYLMSLDARPWPWNVGLFMKKQYSFRDVSIFRDLCEQYFVDTSCISTFIDLPSLISKNNNTLSILIISYKKLSTSVIRGKVSRRANCPVCDKKADRFICLILG